MPVVRCIYCPTMLDPAKGEGDHIIPAAMGEFRNDVRFRRICPSCNHRIGRSEQVLLHCGPEAYLRRVVNPALPVSRQRGRSPVKGAMGVPANLHTIDVGDHRLLVQIDADNAQKARSVDQFVIHDSTGREQFYRLYPNMRPEKVKREIVAMVTPPITGIWLHCDERRMDDFNKLFEAMWPQAQRRDLPGTPVGERPADGTVHLTVNTHYWQSLAKIGFHYYLCHTRRGVRGDEPVFDAIRDFIINGGDRHQFFRTPMKAFTLPYAGLMSDGRIESPTHWCHILGADEMSAEVVAYVQLFAGPACDQREHYIVLGTLDSHIIGLASFVRAHVYLYDDPQPRIGKAGTVKEVMVEIQQDRRLLTKSFVVDR